VIERCAGKFAGILDPAGILQPAAQLGDGAFLPFVEQLRNKKIRFCEISQRHIDIVSTGKFTILCQLKRKAAIFALAGTFDIS
jgi:hypothetical protein